MIARSVILVMALVSLAAVPLTEDPPLASPPKTGTLTGRVVSEAPIDSLAAVSRATGKEYAPAPFDGKTGRFAFRDVPGDAVYDLRVKIGPRTIEGIDLSAPDARMQRLAQVRRRQLGLPPQREHEFVQADADEIVKYVRDMQDFMDIRRVLYVQGHGSGATALVELLRTREFYAARGQIVWRVELWYFQEQFGGWQRQGKQDRVLLRERLSGAEWAARHLEYYPELSVTVDGEGQSKPVEFTVPPADITRGRLPGSDPKVQTARHVLGVAGAESRPRIQGEIPGGDTK